MSKDLAAHGGAKVSAAVFALALSLVFPAAKADVTVAVVASLSGAAAYQSVHGLEFAVDAINAGGGVLGQKLKLAYFDDGCDAAQGEVAARRAIQEHPALIIGHNCSAPSISAAPLYARAGVVQISTQSTSLALTEMNIPSVFRLIGRDDRQGVAAAELVAKRWPRARLAVIDDGEVFGKGLAENVVQGLAAHGLRPQFRQTYVGGASSYGDIVARLGRDKIELLYIAGYTEDIGLLLRQIRAAGISTQVLAGDPGGSDAVRLVAGTAVDGLLFSFPRDPLSYPEVPSLVAAAKAKGVQFDKFAVVNYAALQVWQEAVKRSGSFEGVKVAEELHRGRFGTVIGEVAFDAKGNVGAPQSDWVWYRWRGGKAVVDGPS